MTLLDRKNSEYNAEPTKRGNPFASSQRYCFWAEAKGDSLLIGSPPLSLFWFVLVFSETHFTIPLKVLERVVIS